MLGTRPYSRSLLQAEDFDPNEFICLTRDLSFDKLNAALNDHLTEVKKELQQLVNAEFNGFIKLYSDIGEGGTEEIQAFESKLLELGAEAQVAAAGCAWLKGARTLMWTSRAISKMCTRSYTRWRPWRRRRHS